MQQLTTVIRKAYFINLNRPLEFTVNPLDTASANPKEQQQLAEAIADTK